MEISQDNSGDVLFLILRGVFFLLFLPGVNVRGYGVARVRRGGIVSPVVRMHHRGRIDCLVCRLDARVPRWITTTRAVRSGCCCFCTPSMAEVNKFNYHATRNTKNNFTVAWFPGFHGVFRIFIDASASCLSVSRCLLRFHRVMITPKQFFVHLMRPPARFRFWRAAYGMWSIAWVGCAIRVASFSHLKEKIPTGRNTFFFVANCHICS